MQDSQLLVSLGAMWRVVSWGKEAPSPMESLVWARLGGKPVLLQRIHWQGVPKELDSLC